MSVIKYLKVIKHLGFRIFMVSIKNMHDTITSTNTSRFPKVNTISEGKTSK